MSKPKVWFICTQSHRKLVFTDEHWEQLCAEFDVTTNDSGRNLTTEQVSEGCRGYWGIITGWGAPPLTAEVFENDPDLQIIAHSAGSVKSMLSADIVSRYLVPRNIVTFSGNGAIAFNVAESTIGLLLMTARHWIHFNNHYHQTGQWRPPDVNANVQGLLGSTVGVVSASAVGRQVIRLLQPWDLQIICYDPYVSAEQMQQLGAEKVELNELFERSDHVTVHAPVTAETEKMIGAEQLALLRDGATLVNTSRGWVIDHDALCLPTARFGNWTTYILLRTRQEPAITGTSRSASRCWRRCGPVVTASRCGEPSTTRVTTCLLDCQRPAADLTPEMEVSIV